MFSIVFDKKAIEDIALLKTCKLDGKTKDLIEILRRDPYQFPPPFEKLFGDLAGAYSRRINISHRLVYEVIEDARTVKIISMWSHYDLK